jgi:tetratricopeptide (TPR) repeat protein
MQRFGLKRVLVVLLGVVITLGLVRYYSEYQNRRMPAVQLLLEEATQTALGHDTFIYNPSDYLFLADLWIARGQHGRARALFQWLTDHPIPLRDGWVTNGRTQIEIARRYLQLNDVSHAEKAVATALTKTLWLAGLDAPLTAFFYEYLKVKPLPDAISLAEKARENLRNRDTALMALASALVAHGRYNEAQQVRARVETGHFISTAPRPGQSLSTVDIVNYYLETHQLDKVVELYKQSRHHRRQIGGNWYALAEKLVAVGRVEEALELFANEPLLGDRVRVMVARYYARQGQLQKALQILEQIPNIKDEYTLTEVAEALAAGGKFRQALGIANSLPNKDEAVQRIARQMVERGYYGYAYRLSREITAPEARLPVLIALLRKAVG